MNIIIPMAGMGKRMRPHTLTVPKPLVPIAGKPIVQRLVEDIAKVVNFFLSNYHPGVYDVGSGVSNSFETVADTIIDSVGQGKKEYIVMPNDLKAQYQTSTSSNLVPLQAVGFDTGVFRTIEQGVAEYIEYLDSSRYY